MVYVGGQYINEYDLAVLGVYFLFTILIIYCAYTHPINNGNRGLSVVLAFFVPFVYIIWRAVEVPLTCTGSNPGLSLIFGCCLPPCFVMMLLCEDEPSNYAVLVKV
jgi:hypothetical protein